MGAYLNSRPSVQRQVGIMKLRKYTTDFKLKVVSEAKALNKNSAATKFSVHPKRVREWIKQEVQLKKAKPKSYRLPGAGRPLLGAELDELLLNRIISARLEKRRVTRSDVVEWGQELGTEMRVELKFSEGWLESFFHRHQLVQRKATNKPFLSDDEIIERAVDFVRHVKSLITEYGISLQNIYSLDETALFFEHDKDSTLEIKGSRHVPVFKF